MRRIEINMYFYIFIALFIDSRKRNKLKR